MQKQIYILIILFIGCNQPVKNKQLEIIEGKGLAKVKLYKSTLNQVRQIFGDPKKETIVPSKREPSFKNVRTQPWRKESGTGYNRANHGSLRGKDGCIKNKKNRNENKRRVERCSCASTGTEARDPTSVKHSQGSFLRNSPTYQLRTNRAHVADQVVASVNIWTTPPHRRVYDSNSQRAADVWCKSSANGVRGSSLAEPLSSPNNI